MDFVSLKGMSAGAASKFMAIVGEILGYFFVIVAILVVTLVAVKVVRRLLDKVFRRESHIIKVDPTRYTFIKHMVSGSMYVMGIGLAIYAVPSLRTLSVSLFAGAGIIAIIVGFASQQAFSNIVSGIFIAIFKPFRVGDRVKVGTEISGVVEDITLRQTVIRNYENRRIIVPNTLISNETIENSDIGEEETCKFVEFGISYDSDIDKALKIMEREAKKHPDVFDHRNAEQKERGDSIVTTRVMGFSDSSVILRAWVWAKDAGTAFTMGCDLNKSIKKCFDKEGIEIPFPYRTLVFKDKKAKKKRRQRVQKKKA